MIHDFRIYQPHPGKEKALKERFLTRVLPIFERIGIEVTDVFEPNDDSGSLWYIARFPDEHARQQLWNAFKNDGEWIKTKAESERDGPLLKEQAITLLTSLSGR